MADQQILRNTLKTDLRTCEVVGSQDCSPVRRRWCWPADVTAPSVLMRILPPFPLAFHLGLNGLRSPSAGQGWLEKQECRSGIREGLGPGWEIVSVLVECSAGRKSRFLLWFLLLCSLSAVGDLSGDTRHDLSCVLC